MSYYCIVIINYEAVYLLFRIVEQQKPHKLLSQYEIMCTAKAKIQDFFFTQPATLDRIIIPSPDLPKTKLQLKIGERGRGR